MASTVQLFRTQLPAMYNQGRGPKVHKLDGSVENAAARQYFEENNSYITINGTKMDFDGFSPYLEKMCEELLPGIDCAFAKNLKGGGFALVKARRHDSPVFICACGRSCTTDSAGCPRLRAACGRILTSSSFVFLFARYLSLTRTVTASLPTLSWPATTQPATRCALACPRACGLPCSYTSTSPVSNPFVACDMFVRDAPFRTSAAK